MIGIGGLGHIAIKLLRAMGAEVTAFSSNPAKEQEVLAMGADRVVNSRDPQALTALAGQFDLIINTVAVDLDWQPYFRALAYGGNFHTVGAVMKPFPVPAFTLIGGDRSISGSATGNPSELRKLMKFAGRSKVAPTTELFPMSQINEALKHVREGKSSLSRGTKKPTSDWYLPPGVPCARRFSSCFIKPSSPRHSPVVIASHNPGFHKRLNETPVTMNKRWLPRLILSPSLLFFYCCLPGFRLAVRSMTACLIPAWPATAHSTSGWITSPACLPTAFSGNRWSIICSISC